MEDPRYGLVRTDAEGAFALVLGDLEGPEGVWPDECEEFVWTNNDSLNHFASDPKTTPAARVL